MKTSHARLYVLLARKAQVGVIFRRGPSKQVQLIKWDLQDDVFEKGQWFKGRIYERRSDLSPDGKFLIYFAAKYKGPLQSWTAICNPPFLTAIALWPKGDGWNGGGIFVSSRGILLNHLHEETSLHSKYVKRIRLIHIESYASSRGEDDTIWPFILTRDGWQQTQAPKWSDPYADKHFTWKAIVPKIWIKPNIKTGLALKMSIEGINQISGPWYCIHFQVLNTTNKVLLDLGVIDWADWDKNGDLLFAQKGCLFRQKLDSDKLQPPTLLADFNSNKFEEIPPQIIE